MSIIYFIIGLSLGVGLTIGLILWAALMWSKEQITDVSKKIHEIVESKHEKRGL